MSALARFFNAMGKKVYGYDKTASPLTDQLSAEGIQISFYDDLQAIPSEIIDNQDETMVIYTPAIPSDLKLLNHFQDEEYDLYKRSVVLGMVTDDSLNLSIAGTHGKTTTSCMLASIFKASTKRFNAFLGGISADLGSNYYYQNGEGPLYSISEADEYDRSFLQLNPSWAAITSTDSDHLDIYGEESKVKESFIAFAERIVDPNCLLIAKDKVDGIDSPSYSASVSNADYHVQLISQDSKGSEFNLYHKANLLIPNLRLNIPGLHNVENAVAAAVLALRAEVEVSAIKTALSSFKGIKRRFEYIIDNENFSFIDDYAHHPSEIDAIVQSVRELYPNKKLTVVFQPHLYSRTRDFASGFANSLSKADELILLPIYPARELPIEGVDSSIIASDISIGNVELVNKEDLLNKLKFSDLEVLLTLGAGDIDRLVPKIKQAYHES